MDNDICLIVSMSIYNLNMWGITIHGGHDKTDLRGIRRTGEMSINLLLLGLIQRDEAIEDVLAGQGVIGAALVIGEVILHGADGQLLLEAINLVEEEDDGRLDEPARIAD